jgi:hypothetical protein
MVRPTRYVAGLLREMALAKLVALCNSPRSDRCNFEILVSRGLAQGELSIALTVMWKWKYMRENHHALLLVQVSH